MNKIFAISLLTLLSIIASAAVADELDYIFTECPEDYSPTHKGGILLCCKWSEASADETCVSPDLPECQRNYEGHRTNKIWTRTDDSQDCSGSSCRGPEIIKYVPEVEIRTEQLRCQNTSHNISRPRYEWVNICTKHSIYRTNCGSEEVECKFCDGNIEQIVKVFLPKAEVLEPETNRIGCHAELTQEDIEEISQTDTHLQVAEEILNYHGHIYNFGSSKVKEHEDSSAIISECNLNEMDFLDEAYLN